MGTDNKDPTFSTASMDPEDAALLASLTPEGAVPGSPAFGAAAELELEAAAAAAGAPDASAAPAAAPAAPATAPAAPSPAPAAPAAAPTDAPAPAPAAPAPAPAPAEGDVRAALRHSRRNEARVKEQLNAANDRIRELEATRQAGGNDGANNGDRRSLDDMSTEEVADLRENYPLQYAMLEELRDLRSKVNAPAPAPAPAASAPAPAQEWQPTSYEPQVQEVIDQVPTLLRWQMNEADQPKFNMAAVFDTSLRADPVWSQKTPVERFAEAVRLAELRMGASPGAPAPSPAPAPAAPRTDPAAAIAAAPTTSPSGISDFRGGGPGGAPVLDFNGMSDAQILGSLKPEP
jgi:hypothetical protein